MPKIVISDTSCLVVLEKIQQIDLLRKIYAEVITTPEVNAEFKNPLPTWIVIRSPKNSALQHNLESKIDIGEASAIALSLETEDCVLVLDDLKARKIAASLRVNFTGTLGLLVKAKEMKLIPSVKLLIDKLRMVGLRFSKEIEQEILTQSGE